MQIKSRTETIAIHLRDRVLRGEIKAGTHLQEVAVSQDLGVSRTPVRAAFGILASEGLLEYTPKRGYTVRSFTLVEVAQAHEVRATLEGMACRLAAERRLGAVDLATLERTLAIGDRILERGRFLEEDREAWAEMNDQFHTAIIELAGNRVLAELIERTCRIPLGSHRVLHWYKPEGIKASHDLHHRIYHYIRNGSGASAEAVMREHILLGIDQIRLRAEGKSLDGDGPSTIEASTESEAPGSRSVGSPTVSRQLLVRETKRWK